jgi:thioredoxin 1
MWGEVPVKGMVTMLDVGADRCIPCKMMAPILKELEGEYRGKAAIIFIDVWKRPEQGTKFRVRTIPTQIFYDKDGKEVQRHEGFLDRNAIVEVLERLGVKK